jgi:hypothetical protein
MTGMQTVNSPANKLLMPLMHVMQTMMATARLFEMDAEVSVSPFGSDSSIIMTGVVSSSMVELVCEGDIVMMDSQGAQ